YPEEAAGVPEPVARQAGLREPTVPLFRARLIGLGFDPERELVLIELRERSSDDEEEGDALTSADETVDELSRAVADAAENEDEDGYVARIYATRPQVRAMAAKGAEAVAAGRPLCPLCDMPMDPSGHRCPRWNWVTPTPSRSWRAASSRCWAVCRGRRTPHCWRSRGPTASRCRRSTSHAGASARCGTS